MRVVLCSIGTTGDLTPALEFGSALSERGHDVSLATAEPFEGAVRSRGLGFVKTLDGRAYERVVNDARLWRSTEYFKTLLHGFMVPSIAPLVAWAAEQPKPDEILYVAGFSSGVAAKAASEVTGARQPIRVAQSRCSPKP